LTKYATTSYKFRWTLVLIAICGSRYVGVFSFFMTSLLLHVPTHKMPNLLDTYNTYIEETSFGGLAIRSNALERYLTHQG
jgi:hypothetical protein